MAAISKGKTHDGKGGRPDEANNTASPCGSVLDRITSGDFLDMASEIAGRS